MRCTSTELKGLVVKRFRSADRGGPVREWAALSLLARFAAGLVPTRVSADLHSDVRVITMSLQPGTELSAAPVTSTRMSALAVALERLGHSVPSIDKKFTAAVTPSAEATTTRPRSRPAGSRSPHTENLSPRPNSAGHTPKTQALVPNPTAFTHQVRQMLAAHPPLGKDAVVARPRYRRCLAPARVA